MKKFFLMLFALMFTGSVFSAETYVTNATDYKVKVNIKFGGICNDEEFVLNGRSYKKFVKYCCLHHVKATGLEGPIASSATEEVGGLLQDLDYHVEEIIDL